MAQHLNYSEASRRLHVAQPAISQTILDLEDELGVKLLLRTKRSVQLTAAGTTFLREAEEILRRANEAQPLAQRAARREVGILSVGFCGTAAAPILPALVRAYRRKFPDVKLRRYELNPEQQLAAFDKGRIDLGRSRPLPSDRRSGFEEEVVYVSPSHCPPLIPRKARSRPIENVGRRAILCSSIAMVRPVCSTKSLLFADRQVSPRAL